MTCDVYLRYPSIVVALFLVACGGGTDSGGGNECEVRDTGPSNNVNSCINHSVDIFEFCGVDCKTGEFPPLIIRTPILKNTCEFAVNLGFIEAILYTTIRTLRAGQSIRLSPIDDGDVDFIACRPPSVPEREELCPLFCSA